MSKSNKTLLTTILIVSVLIPIVVAFLIFKSETIIDLESSSLLQNNFFPKFHATLNSLTVVCLIFSLYFIKRKKVSKHTFFNWSAVVLSSIFLVSYVIYHSAAPSVMYGDIDRDGVLSMSEKSQAGVLRYVYYFILVSHILLACVIVPLVLYTILAVYKISHERHRKIAKITWPVWMYVAVTGVAVYFLINPYY